MTPKQRRVLVAIDRWEPPYLSSRKQLGPGVRDINRACGKAISNTTWANDALHALCRDGYVAVVNVGKWGREWALTEKGKEVLPYAPQPPCPDPARALSPDR